MSGEQGPRLVWTGLSVASENVNTAALDCGCRLTLLKNLPSSFLRSFKTMHLRLEKMGCGYLCFSESCVLGRGTWGCGLKQG